MRYYSRSSEDVASLTIKKLGLRLANFRKVNEQAIKFQATIAGAKFK